MNERDAEFLQRLRAVFLTEARDHLLAIGTGLVALEKGGSPVERGQHVEAVFRHTHSLKGAARAAGFPRIEKLCQTLEEIFALCKRRGRVLPAGNFDVLHRAFDMVSADVDAGGGTVPNLSPDAIAAMLTQLEAIARGEAAVECEPESLHEPESSAEEAVDQPPAVPDADTGAVPVLVREVTSTVRVQTPRLDRVLLAAEELLTVKQAGAERTEELRLLELRFGLWSKHWLAAQPALRRLRSLVATSDPGTRIELESVTRALEFLEWNYGHQRSLEGDVRAIARSAARDSHFAGKQIDELLDDSKTLRMLPFSALSEALPKLVRDLARDQDKQVDLQISGEDVQLDKRMVELLRDPLVHLVRNALDHGVELPAKRQAAGKPPRATLQVQARLLHGNQISIEIADDGAGLDPQRLRKAALRSGVLGEDAARELNDAQALELAFRSDVSTSPIITEISGRGLGLAIVREQVERLGGRVEVENREPCGARFRILLPQSMAMLRGLFVEACNQVFVLPSAHVERVIQVPRASSKTVGQRETLTIDGQVVALARLHQLLEMPAFQSAADPMTVVLLGAGHQRVALVVDEVLHEGEVLVKRLRRPLVRVRNIAGATVLASGKPVPILNVADLLKSARHTAVQAPVRPEAKEGGRPLAQRVLLAEDSITSRLLLKGILESAGCKVRAVADGIEAFTALRSESFDLLVSDIEMPRLNGFDLTLRIRADHKLADLPVVLVTALSRREDRERGIDVGANAYIAKGSFDQRELLEAVRRLAGARESS
ncbi:response regulator [Rhodanobacter sp. 7MK24]|uniref:hybrid sensor histidine kinase/response regulator n=1 Tax=Rhodanobacter sp. 7MK24 TaxID=2775922 RepID=UPI001780A0EC|nr:response regulator [Rhodanobacter sp. 7MK24]MBD8880875.1 response regulator [Rhodanobacter sp. 7MK24]